MKRYFYITVLAILISNCTNSNKDEIDLSDVPLKIEFPFIYDNFLKDNLYPFDKHIGHIKIYFGARKNKWHPLSRTDLLLDGHFARTNDIKYWYKNILVKDDLDQIEIFALVDRDVPELDISSFLAAIDSLNNDKIYIAVKVINDQNEFEYNWMPVKKMIEKSDSIDAHQSLNNNYYRVITFENWINEY